ncbi:MAG: RluA family pseudouridine synthase [Acidimicrobiales bacterium]
MDEVIPAALAGQRVDRVVAMITGISRAEVAALVARGKVSVDDQVVTARSQRVEEGAHVHADLDELVAAAEHAMDAEPDVPVTVVHADEHLIVVDKPAGLVVHPGAGNRQGTLVQGLLAHYPELAGIGGDPDRPGIVHRLDKGTSGLLLVARSPEAYTALVAQLQAHEVERRYLALVWGELDALSGMIDAPIGRSAREPTRMVVSTRGKEARTRYEVVSTFTEPVTVSLLECRLETGRTHQIRVHLTAIDHPVVGDARYGGARSSFPVERPWLHAAALHLDHPITGEPMDFESPLPADLEAWLDRLS